jgi:hypothetical protein
MVESFAAMKTLGIGIAGARDGARRSRAGVVVSDVGLGGLTPG